MATVIERSGNEVTVAVTVRLDGSLLEMEEAIQAATNEVGCCVSEEALQRFDTDGCPIRVGETKLTAHGRDPKEYQTPYGAVRVERYVQHYLGQGRGLGLRAAAACSARCHRRDQSRRGLDPDGR